MIPPHTVFLLQFAKYRPNCAPTVAASPAAAPLKTPAAPRVSPLRRLLAMF